MAKNEYYYHIWNHRRERLKSGEHGRKPAPEMLSGAPLSCFVRQSDEATGKLSDGL